MSHPNIVSVHEVGRDGESAYIVSDLVQGVTLGDWMAGQALSGREAAELCVKIAEALYYAHERGVVHRDLKPANIMMDDGGEPHLMDFGLARREVGEVTMTMEGQVLGTPAYMSPEQARGESHTADCRSDIYSLGVILFELLTGELPFRGNVRMLLQQVVNDQPPSPRKFNASVARDLETITLKCLETDCNRRYATSAEVADELRRFCDGKPILARPITKLERGWRWCQRHPAIAMLIGVFAIAFVIVTWQWLTIREAQERWAFEQVDKLTTMPAVVVPTILKDLEPFHGEVATRLEQMLGTENGSAGRQLRLHLALLPDDASHAPAVINGLLDEGRSVEYSDLLKALAVRDRAVTITAMKAVIDERPAEKAAARELDHLAKRRAYAATALARLGAGEQVWDLLDASRDPSTRSYFIDRFASTGSDPGLLAGLFNKSRSERVRRAAYLMLGSVAYDPSESSAPSIQQILNVYEHDPDPGIHAAVRWVLTSWNLSDELAAVDARLKKLGEKGLSDKRWYVNSEGQTMLAHGPAVFQMGSPPNEVDRLAGEILHDCEIDRTFAIAMCETTIEQFRRFREPPSQDAASDSCPVHYMAWSDAAAYCNWLSERDGIARDQWCYVENVADRAKLAPANDCLELRGYRLPTEAEWEFSCRAGASTPFFFGGTPELQPIYSWCPLNSPRGKKQPVGLKKPNDAGVFDIYGNALEWCHDFVAEYPKGNGKHRDRGGASQSKSGNRALRGSAAGDFAPPRSALRDGAPPEERINAIGFRVARTIQPVDN